jgi:AcrR family transcriptional regulator
LTGNDTHSITICQHEITVIQEGIMAKSSRERLLQAAIELMSKRGYRETTVGDIEVAAGLTRRAGGFYRHFSSKEEVLVEALRRMAGEMVAEIQLKEVISLKSVRAELLVMARAMMRHAEQYRPLRLILQREGNELPVLHNAARRANARLASQDLLPWVRHALRRSGMAVRKLGERSLLIFGPVLFYIFSVDRGDPAFGVRAERFLDLWADHWTDWFRQDR